MPGRVNRSTADKARAVALKYQPLKDRAPRIVATGRGRVAEQIIRIARENDVHIHDDPDLVEVLAQFDLNAEIPPDLYRVVSELLAFVYSLNRQEMNR